MKERRGRERERKKDNQNTEVKIINDKEVKGKTGNEDEAKHTKLITLDKKGKKGGIKIIKEERKNIKKHR